MTGVFIHVSSTIAADIRLRGALAMQLQAVGIFELPANPLRPMDAAERAAFDAKRAAGRARMWKELEAAGVRREDVLGVYAMNYVAASPALQVALSDRGVVCADDDGGYGPVVLLDGADVTAVVDAADPALRAWLDAHPGLLLFGVY